MQLALLLTACLLGQGATKPDTPPVTPPKPELKMTDVSVGKGDTVVLGDRVTVDYTGKLPDGTVFDTSKKPGRTAFSFVVGIGEVIKGWDQGVLGMKAGGVRKLTIPSDLAYGDRGAPPTIPPKATLVFTVAVNKVEHVITQIKTEISKAGTGRELTWGDTGTMKVVGKTGGGTVFLDTDKLAPNQPGVKFILGQNPFIEGFTLGVLGMKSGEKRTLTIPPTLAYGENGNPRIGIKANETITFEVELVSIEPSSKDSSPKEPATKDSNTKDKQ